ncbi:hypothetical protein N8I77_013109 [Diaporthe amygdali]|uniref:Uncharacterized protein n=1 Tax=Phomopsis amygdali TaxID=1214568 RepID=A0AAD9S3M2_PHOAM|nr:hypothetical protein N8I77_013109 [Diaporthe amygdali]
MLRIKMYKRRLREYNCRKNIRSTRSDIQTYQNLSSSRQRQRPTSVMLSNGQVVATDLLAIHLHRKMNRNRTPPTIKPPDKYYFAESVYVNIRSYLLGRYHACVTIEEAFANTQETAPYTQKWSSFIQTLSDALDRSESMHLSEALVVMQQAPQELSIVLERQPPNIIGSIFMFLVVVAPRRAGISYKESQMFIRVVKSLLNFGATALPARHPLHQILRSLAKWETEDIQNFAENNATTCDQMWEWVPPGSAGRMAIFSDCVHLSIANQGSKTDQSNNFTPSLSQQRTPIGLKECYEWLTQSSNTGTSKKSSNDLS